MAPILALFLHHFGPSLHHLGVKGSQKGAKGGQRGAKGSQKERKGAKREPKGGQKEPKGGKMEPKSIKNRCRNVVEKGIEQIIEKTSKMMRKWSQNPSTIYQKLMKKLDRQICRKSRIFGRKVRRSQLRLRSSRHENI